MYTREQNIGGCLLVIGIATMFTELLYIYPPAAFIFASSILILVGLCSFIE